MSTLPKSIEKSKVPLSAKKKTSVFIDYQSILNTKSFNYKSVTLLPNNKQVTNKEHDIAYKAGDLLPPALNNHGYTFITSAVPSASSLQKLATGFTNNKTQIFLNYDKADFSKEALKQMLIGYALNEYRFDHYKTVKSDFKIPKIIWPDEFTAKDKAEVTSTVDAITMVRDLINTPSNDMTPFELMRQTKALADEFNASSKIYHHQATVAQQFPLIYSVGKASMNKPGLAEFTWGNKNHPKVTLVGKGVTFDSGGLNIKVGGSMRKMKADMGGAANVLGLARILMGMNLPIRLRVIIPTAHNAINEKATSPSDIVKSRKGLTVQIDNTDAEGRLLLADALTLASEEKPDLLIDMATLTGSATAAYTDQCSALFTGDTKLGRELEDISYDVTKDLMQHTRYDATLERGIKALSDADLNHIIPGSNGGMIIAAEFLKQFVDDPKKHIHLDISAYDGRGGKDASIKTLTHYLKKKYKPV